MDYLLFKDRPITDIVTLNRFPKDWRILITGVTSIHGWPIYQQLRQLCDEDQLFAIRPPGTEEPQGKNILPCCITDYLYLQYIKEKFKPTHVISCSGVCDLDQCEERPHWTRTLNCDGADNMVSLFGDHCFMVQMSNDLVFSGKKGNYSEDDPTDPISVVGRSMVEAENSMKRAKKSLIVRLGLPIGDSISGKKGGWNWSENRLKNSRPLTCFTDEYRSNINCEELAIATLALLQKEEEGLYHLGGPERVSLYGLGEAVLVNGGYDPSLISGILRSEEVDGPPRIGDASLDSGKIKILLESLFFCK